MSGFWTARVGPVEGAVALLVAGGLAAYAVLLLVRGPVPRHPEQIARLLATLDVDGSGALEAPELDGRDPPGHSWHVHDLDGDGRLDPREIEIALEDLDPRWLLPQTQ